jgi:hypothetical protein
MNSFVTAQVDSRQLRTPITFGAVTKVVRTVHCAAPSQETPLPHRGLCGDPFRRHPRRSCARCPKWSAQSTVRLRVRRRPFRTGDCADHFTPTAFSTLSSYSRLRGQLPSCSGPLPNPPGQATPLHPGRLTPRAPTSRRVRPARATDNLGSGQVVDLQQGCARRAITAFHLDGISAG